MNRRAGSPSADEPAEQSTPPAVLDSPVVDPVAARAVKPVGATRQPVRKAPSEKLAGLPAPKPARPVADSPEPTVGARNMIDFLDHDIPLTARHGLLISIAIVAGLLVAFLFGQMVGRKASLASTAEKVPTEVLPKEALPRLDAAFSLLRDGKSSEALDTLKALLADFPNASSLSYAAAIAARPSPLIR